MIKEIIFGIVGGLGLFIYGMWEMGEGLHKAYGNKMREVLSGFLGNPLKGVLAGAGVTSLIQSSSATTVIVVGFVNAGLMSLRQSLGIIFGANIGTTITAQLIAFKLTDYALLIIGLGMLVLLLAKKKNHKYLGEFILGFGILFLGLSIMTSVVKPLGKSALFNQILLNFSMRPLSGILAGAVITAILQSSSITTGMVLALAMSGLISLNSALPLILGCNIGTCITALLGSIGTNLNARRTALAHVLFNVTGVIVFLPFLKPFANLVSHLSASLPRQIANAHSLFNIMNTMIFLPFVGLYAKLLTKILKGEEEEEIEYLPRYLERHLLSTPPIAIDASIREIIRTLELSKKMIGFAMKGFFKDDSKILSKVTQGEDAVDNLRLSVTNYLVELMQHELSRQESAKIPALIHIINDVERVGDHAENLKALAEQKIEAKLPLSDMAVEELNKIYTEINQMTELTIAALRENNLKAAESALEKENYINNLRDELKQNHVRRLEQGVCRVLSGVVFLDIISNLEKIADHLTNIAQAVIGSLQWDRANQAR